MMYMNIKIIAPNINTGGALVLLKYLTIFLKNNLKDDCISLIFVSPQISLSENTKNLKIITDQNTFKIFLLKMKNTLYFGNLPPFFKSENSIVYIHEPLANPHKKLII